MVGRPVTVFVRCNVVVGSHLQDIVTLVSFTADPYDYLRSQSFSEDDTEVAIESISLGLAILSPIGLTPSRQHQQCRPFSQDHSHCFVADCTALCRLNGSASQRLRPAIRGSRNRVPHNIGAAASLDTASGILNTKWPGAL